ncbi:peptidase M16 [Parashewanella spongiae]|uniref:Protease 3 n=1 Tax=Parashewanella spongiae TaxID=342950 RepID=A0A3A6U960_9GAMM|nr:insulinase family protein [Parashewanella spongiae]MCL1077750.1 insulinase family protein [Parashewanella spongiae]RJY18049.1 peptidase M16 [Parashewanella spongiae]
MKNLKFNLLSTAVALAIGVTTLASCGNVSTPVAALDPNVVVKSQNDQREYRHIVLSNGLKAVLVSDSKADKSAASIDVHIGHMADPEDREGLTHFLEHMLFLGTEKYPKVGEYNEYLKANGGWSNAGTGQEHTNYFFEVNQNAFEEAVDRFAQFFISPSLDPEFVEREKNAVHSEYSMKIKDDARRIREVLKDTTNQAHPASQFSVGNLDTLADRENDLLIDDLTEQYKKYYTASRMSLVLVGKEDLDTLEKWAKEKFTAVPNNGSVSLPVEVKPYLDEQLAVRINIEPMKDTRNLTLYFPVESSTKYFAEKPLDLISDLLANEGEGSLFSYLKQEGLLESLSSYHYGPDDHEQFVVTMTLTEDGLNNYQSVTESVFSYISLLSDESYNRNYFEEMKSIAKINFDFSEKQSPAGTARSLSSKLQYYPANHVVNSSYHYGDYSHKLVTGYLSKLTPENMRLVLTAKGLETDKVQPLYDTPYSMTKLNADEVARYNKPKKINALKLPKANPFIAQELSLKSTEGSLDKPSVVFEKAGFKVWHKQDSEFNVPKAALYVQIYSDMAGKDVNSRAKNYLYTALLNDSLNEFGYPARQAGLNYNVWSTSAGIGFGVEGYDEKSTSLLSTINNRVRNLEINPDSFKLHKERLIRQWNNAKFDRPYSQARSALSQLQRDKAYSKENLAEALSSVTSETLANYISDFHKEIEVEAMIHGNKTKAESLKISDSFYKQIMRGSKPKVRAQKVVKLNTTGQAVIQQLDIDHNDSTLVMTYVSDDKSINIKAKYALLGNMISAPFFQQIRTEQQLGYIVGGNSSSLEELPLISFLIQSPKVGAVELNRRVDTFIADYKETLTKLTTVEFENYKQGVVKNLRTKHKNQGERTRFYWSEISKQKFDFNSNEQLAKAVELLDHKSMVEFYDYALYSVKPIVVRSFGKAHQDSPDYQLSIKEMSVNLDTAELNKSLTKFKL